MNRTIKNKKLLEQIQKTQLQALLGFLQSSRNMKIEPELQKKSILAELRKQNVTFDQQCMAETNFFNWSSLVGELAVSKN